MDELHGVGKSDLRDRPGESDGASHRGRFSWTRVVVAVLPLAVGLAVALWTFYDPLPPTASLTVAGQRTDVPASPSRHPFDLSNAIVPESEIHSGGPPIDGIPALSQPAFVPADEASYLAAADRVVGVKIDVQARAYPLKILNHHEIINDQVAGHAIAVTYCPLCDSAAVIDRDQTIEGRALGVSGLLYNSNVLMYDRGADRASLWSQLLGRAIAGPLVEQPLVYLPVSLTSWHRWKGQHPETRVLSDQTGHARDYLQNPYADYFQSDRMMFPVAATSDRLPPRMRIVAVWSADTYRAYPESLFNGQLAELTDRIDGKELRLEKAGTQGIRVAAADPELQWAYAFWFAWYAMHPETEVAGE